MAQIKMDISEYEAMKETKRLLEASLKRERQQQDRIDELHKEKIKAYEDAKMKVIHTVKTSVTEHLLVKRSPKEIFARLRAYFYSSEGEPYALNQLQDIFFDKTTSYGSSIEPTITTKGLDEVKEELREVIEKDVKYDKKRTEEIFNKQHEFLAQISKLEKETSVLHDEAMENSRLLEKKETKIKELTETISKVKDVVKHGYGKWGKGLQLSKIIKIVGA